MNQIKSLTNELVKNNINMTFADFINEIFVLIGKSPSEISGPKISKMVTWISIGGYIIDQTELANFGILKSSDMESIQQYLNDNSFKHNKDYQIRNNYYLLPNTFKICLIRSFNYYANYYLFLEDSYQNYIDYQKQLMAIKENTHSGKNTSDNSRNRYNSSDSYNSSDDGGDSDSDNESLYSCED